MTEPNKLFNVLQPIRPYDSPLWTIEPHGDEITGADVDEELCNHITIEDDRVYGWMDNDNDQYTKIISTQDEHGETRYYLAGWKG